MKDLKILWKVVWFFIQAIVILILFDNVPYGESFVGYGIIALYSFAAISFANLQLLSGLQSLLVLKTLRNVADEEHREEIDDQIIELEGKFNSSTTERIIYSIFWGAVWIFAVLGMMG